MTYIGGCREGQRTYVVIDASLVVVGSHVCDVNLLGRLSMNVVGARETDESHSLRNCPRVSRSECLSAGNRDRGLSKMVADTPPSERGAILFTFLDSTRCGTRAFIYNRAMFYRVCRDIQYFLLILPHQKSLGRGAMTGSNGPPHRCSI